MPLILDLIRGLAECEQLLDTCSADAAALLGLTDVAHETDETGRTGIPRGGQ
ncbi:MAG: hypothetical protein ACYDCQ_19545 [Dehalococcoidia bacterium]